MVTIKPSEVKRTGENLFPGLANKFRTSNYLITGAQDDKGASGMGDSAFLTNWAMYNAQIGLYLSASARHLDDCGQVLVDLANDHDWTDQDNAYNLDKADEGSLQEAADDRARERRRNDI